MARQEILLIENEGDLAREVQSQLEKLAYQVTAIGSTDEAIRRISVIRPDLVLMDTRLQSSSDENDAAALIRQKFNLPIIFLTGLAEEPPLERIKAAEPYGFLTAPIREVELHSALQIAHYKHKLEQERSNLLGAERETIQITLDRIVKMLTELLALAAPQSLAQGQKLREYVQRFAQALEIRDTRELETAALLCQIGYLHIPALLIQKLRAGITLTPAERHMVNRIPELGRKILNCIPRLEAVAEIIFYHRKNFDGTGFPAVIIAGKDIPIGARLLRIVHDLYELEISGLARGRIADQMTTNYGHYDPVLLRKAIQVLVDSPPSGSRAVELRTLGIGDLLAAPIETPEGTILIGGGTRISQALLQKVHHFAETGKIREPVYIVK